jgi:hypothetical protein
MGYTMEETTDGFVILNCDGAVESVWDSEEEAQEEIRSLRVYWEDLVDYFARATPGMQEDEED